MSNLKIDKEDYKLKSSNNFRIPIHNKNSKNVTKKGSIIYNSEDDKLYYSDGVVWNGIGSAANSITLTPLTDDIQILEPIPLNFEIKIGKTSAVNDTNIIIYGKNDYTNSFIPDPLIDIYKYNILIGSELNRTLDYTYGPFPNSWYNTVVGIDALTDSIDGYTTCIGYSSGIFSSRQTGAGVCIGSNSGKLDSTYVPVAIGYESLNTLFTTYKSVSLGYKSGYNQEGMSVSIGCNSVCSNGASVTIGNNSENSGSGSVIVGTNSFIDRYLNIVVGNNCYGNNINSTESIHIGYDSGYLSDSFNISIGSKAGTGTKDSNPPSSRAKEGSICIGHESGYNDVAGNGAGIGSIIIGHQACKNETTLPNSIQIGNGCKATGASGRLGFGNNMKIPLGSFPLPNAGVPQKYLKIQWNGTLYYVPLFTTTPS